VGPESAASLAAHAAGHDTPAPRRALRRGAGVLTVG